MQPKPLGIGADHELFKRQAYPHRKKPILYCFISPSKTVGLLLKEQVIFYDLEHYPKDGVFDEESHRQYNYHAHRQGGVEHGFSHTFSRQSGIPGNVFPVD
ncbi:MAG: DUF6969 family protein [Gammaproteobacteria bacterium]